MAVMLEHYEAILDVSHRMLAAARRGDWDAVAQAEAEVDARFQALRQCQGPDRLLEAHERRRRLEILRDVLADDAEIRNLAQPWLCELDRWMCSGRTPPARPSLPS